MENDMSTIENVIEAPSAKEKSAVRREKIFSIINKSAAYLGVAGLGWLVPLMKIAAGDNPREQMGEVWQQLCIPLAGLIIFMSAWAWLAPKVDTSLGAIPGPAQVYEQAVNLYQDHLAERQKKADFM
ncbi:MAG: nitrate ABC transporter permease, partial [Candidatus Omnitrophica bacterium CG11_big_fil_rev_8_21_14_0_20_63_9]